MGSVKDLNIIKPAQKTIPGKGRFIFSDRYSVFDWGEMPDLIPNKGKALCIITSYFFEMLEKEGINTHYRGVIQNNEVKQLSELTKPVAKMEVDLVRVLKPQFKENHYDYSIYKKRPVNCLIPLEVIYRNTLPEHSSFRRREQNGEINIEDYGLSKLPPAREFLENPIYDVSTKLESTDRYISWEKAKKIAGLDKNLYQEIIKILETVNSLITREVSKTGLKNLDGKIEVALNENRELMVVDAIGTPDECRFKLKNFSISKETIRKYYRGSKWYKELSQAKKENGPKWKDSVGFAPHPLPKNLLTMISEMYMACTNEITGNEWFKNIRSLAKLKEEMSEQFS